MQFAFRKPFDPDSDGPDQRITLRARLRDTGGGRGRLRQLNVNIGALRTLATYDSDSTTNPLRRRGRFTAPMQRVFRHACSSARAAISIRSGGYDIAR